MAVKGKTTSAKTKKSSNPVGRPRKKYGHETLLDHKKSFKLDENNVVLDKIADALIVAAIMLIVVCVILYIAVK